MPGEHQRANAKSARLDKELPYQVALPDDICCMENFTIISAFCQRYSYRVETKGVIAVWPEGKQIHMRLHCFAGRSDADAFAAHFEGEFFNPTVDYGGKRRHRGAWRRTGSWEFKEQWGRLRMPKFFRENP